MTQSEPIGMFLRMHIGPRERKLHKLINSHVFGSLSPVCLMSTPKNVSNSNINSISFECKETLR